MSHVYTSVQVVKLSKVIEDRSEASQARASSQVRDLKSMSSKTILIGLSIFRYGCEKSVHGRPSWEFAPYDRESERTRNFAAWCKDVSSECCFNECAGECGVVRFTTQFFVLDKAKAIPIRIGSQTAWEAVRNDFVENKEKIVSKDYELHGRCSLLFAIKSIKKITTELLF